MMRATTGERVVNYLSWTGCLGTGWLRRGWRTGLAALAIAASLQHDAIAQGPDAPPQPAMPSPAEMDYTLPFDDASGSAAFRGPAEDTVGGFGIKGRAGHQAGSTVGRRQSITYFDLSPYVFQNNTFYFGEARLALGNNGHVGGSTGGGLRQYFPAINTIGGFSAWWDGDGTRSADFQQWGLSGEILSEWLDVRTNFYFPYGQQFAITGQRFEPGTQQFVNSPDGVGTNILFQRRVFTATAMGGFDVMFTAPIPGDVAQQINLEATAGFYHYSADQESVEKAWGWKARLDGDLWERFVHSFLEVTHDKVFDTNVVFGIDVNFWNNLEHRPRLGHSQYHRLAEWTRRNRTVVAFEGSFLSDPEVAINPDTDLPYLVYQVNSETGFPTGPGTLDQPFDDLQAAIDFINPEGRNADIIFAQGNSVFNSPITINVDNMQVIGEQQNPSIEIPVVGLPDDILLPTVTTPPFDTPVIQGVTGPAVTLAADNTRFSGINITNVTDGPAILAEGITGAEINDLVITNVSGADANGIELNDNSGLITLENITIRDIEGTSFLVDGGNANITWDGSNLIDNTANSHTTHGFSVQVLDAGGSVNMSNTLIQDIGGQGIQVTGSVPGESTANVTFEDVSLTDTVAPTGTGAFYVFTHSGAVNLTGDVTIDNASEDSLVIRDLQPTGTVTSGGDAALTISNRNGTGLLVENIQENTDGTQAGAVVFNGQTTVTGVNGGTDPAILFRSDVGVLSLVGLTSIDGSNGDGVEITAVANAGLSTGRFLVSNPMSITDVDDISFNLHDITKENYRVSTNGLTITERGTGAISVDPGDPDDDDDDVFVVDGVGIEVFNYAGTAAFLGTNQINNENDSFGSAVSVQSNSGAVAFENVIVEDALGQLTPGAYNPFWGVIVYNNTNTDSGVSFGSLDVESSNATAVSFISNAFVTVGTGIIDATNGRGIEILNPLALGSGGTAPPVHNLTFESISASNSDYGILIERQLDPTTSQPIRSEGSFIVTGLNGVAGSGGEISNMALANAITTVSPLNYPLGRSTQFVNAAGALFQDTQIVELNLMDFNNNNIGVAADQIITEDLAGNDPSVFLDGLSITDSASEGIRMRDVSDFTLQNSTVSENGVANEQEQIEIIANTSEIDIDLDDDGEEDEVQYRFVFDNNDITDSLTTTIDTNDMIFIHTGAGIQDPVLLNLFFINNGQPPNGNTTVTSNRDGGNAALNVDWEGTFNATITNNEFVLLTGAGQVGVGLNIDGVADVVFSDNAMTGRGTSDTGLRFVFQEQAAVEISNNSVEDPNGGFLDNSGFVFNNANSIAMDLTFQSNNNRIFIENNLIQFATNARSGTAIQFSRIFGNNGDTTVTINGNRIAMFPFNNTQAFTIERGIFFQDVRGLITLNGSVDNIITPTTLLPFYDNFSIPAGTSQGTILVNGTPVP